MSYERNRGCLGVLARLNEISLSTVAIGAVLVGGLYAVMTTSEVDGSEPSAINQKDPYGPGRLVPPTPEPRDKLQVESDCSPAENLVNSMFGGKYSTKDSCSNQEQHVESNTIQAATNTPEIPTPAPITILVEPTPTPEVPTCHGLQEGQSHPFQTGDGNIGLGEIIRDPNGGMDVFFRGPNVIYDCSQVTPR